MIVGLARTMRERGIRPELEVFDSGMAYLANDLLDRGAVSAQVRWVKDGRIGLSFAFPAE